MPKFQENEIDLQSINNGNRFEDGKPVSASAVNAPIEAAYRVQNIVNESVKTYSVFGEVGYSSSLRVYAYMQYTRLGEKRGLFRVTCNIPQNNLEDVWNVFSTEKINNLFYANHGIKFKPNGERAFAFYEGYSAGTTQYSPLADWVQDGIGIGRIHTTSGDYGRFTINMFSGVFHTEFFVNEV